MRPICLTEKELELRGLSREIVNFSCVLFQRLAVYMLKTMNFVTFSG